MDLDISLIVIVVGILAILVALLCSCAGRKSKSVSGRNFNPSTISTLSPYGVEEGGYGDGGYGDCGGGDGGGGGGDSGGAGWRLARRRLSTIISLS